MHDMTFKYQGISAQSCEWVSKNESEKLCSESNVVKNCPETCGYCLVDDPIFFYRQINDEDDMRNCA